MNAKVEIFPTHSEEGSGSGVIRKQQASEGFWGRGYDGAKSDESVLQTRAANGQRWVVDNTGGRGFSCGFYVGPGTAFNRHGVWDGN
jgi:hypothetical protein